MRAKRAIFTRPKGVRRVGGARLPFSMRKSLGCDWSSPVADSCRHLSIGVFSRPAEEYTRVKWTEQEIFVEVFSPLASLILKIQHFEFPYFHSALHHSGSLGRDVWL